MRIVADGQYRYTPEQADLLAELKGYGSYNGPALMADLDYFHCVECGNYVVEPGGYSDKHNGVLCDKCAIVAGIEEHEQEAAS